MGSETPVVVGSGRFTSPRLVRHWHAVAFSSEVTTKPIGRVLLDRPIVLFRDRYDRVAALSDRCPHRNVPLSIGRCVESEIECRYHGWRFDATGACTAVPGLETGVEGADRPVRRVATFEVCEQDGLVWVVPGGDGRSLSRPPLLVGVGNPGYRTIEMRLDVPGPMVAAVENALDVPHTSFLHRGLFRGRAERVAVSVTVRHGDDRVEAVFDGEPVPPGIVGRLLAPRGGVIEHTDRFVVPALAQVEYRIGSRHVALNAFYTPVSDQRCVLHTIAAYRLPIPVFVARAVVRPLAWWILRQDNMILRRQADNVKRFGGEQFVNTPIDLLGTHIVRLLRRHERAEVAPFEPVEDEHVVLMT